jgi:AcrR family transcriptional regulator
MARLGGPDAVVLREATRRAGVAPNAAYRHFADRLDLLNAVCSAAQSIIADAIEDELARLPEHRNPLTRARSRLRGLGTAYLHSAQAEPGLFRTAFSVPGNLDGAFDPARAGRAGRTPFQILSEVLDDLVSAGALTAERRPGAEFLAWSAVHGLATLIIEGPLGSLDEASRTAVSTRLLDMVEQGL